MAELPKLRMPDGWVPPVPSFSSKVVEQNEELVILYLGSQSSHQQNAASGFENLLAFLSAGDAQPYWLDKAMRQSGPGYWEYVAIAYFHSVGKFESWAEMSGFERWWQDDARLTEAAGYWQERLVLPGERIEALHSSYNKDGHSNGGELVGPIRHHAYWGGMRDRLPISRMDFLHTEVEGYHKRKDLRTQDQRIVVPAPSNLAVIRSGQDRRFASEQERALYADIVRENLLKGMRFLEDNGDEVGCYSCRYMTEIDDAGQPVERNFGHCLFRSLEDLEEWAKSHPTHLAIFGSFFQLQKMCNNEMTLRFYHEVGVCPASAQHFEYINCHPQTGMLGYF